ncbi:MAG: hypothetical protein WB919_08775, partial [Candidatus Sulfotelmatobacter sp.]
MYKKRNVLGLFVTAWMLTVPAVAGLKKGDKAAPGSGEITGNESVSNGSVPNELINVLWREPTDIRSRNLYYGPGGEAHQPHSTFTFEKEDMD